MKHLTLEDIKIQKPDFNSTKAKKGYIVSMWLIELVHYVLEHGIADVGDLIPNKEILSKYLNVSSATVQNSIRYVKNLGYLNSKQSVGTSIADFYSNEAEIQNDIEKNSITECKIKKIVIDKKIKLNSNIPSIKEISLLTDISQNTIRQALCNFELKGYVEKLKSKGNKYYYIYKKEFELSENEILLGLKDEDFTLTHQLIEKIKKYLQKTYKQGDKILPNSALARMFNVSIKTINDTMKILANQKIILPRRGRYGTIYVEKNSKNKFMDVSSKKSIAINYTYSWQKALEHLKKYIIDNYETGDKLPSIRALGKILNVSPNTIRRALKSMIKNGNLKTRTGKLGGIFIEEMPEGENYRWLAINPDVVKIKD